MLLEYGVDFETQYTFPDLLGVGGRSLRFDFAIFENGVLRRLIEFNGLQHYERPKGSWSRGYNRLVENDLRKIEYCERNNIDLKIIKYGEKYDINDLLY